MYYFTLIILIVFSFRALSAENFQWDSSNNTAFAKEKEEQLIGRKTGLEISKAQPEEITSENYPMIIDSITFYNTPLKEIIKTMSKNLNINIIMDPSIANKTLSIVSESPISVAEYYQVFLTALSFQKRML